MRSIAPPLAVAGLAVLAGCLWPSTDGLSTPDGADAGDASVDGCVDCLDASTPDVAADALSDASDAGDAAALGFCDGLSPKPVFCEDFDSNAVFSAQFTNVHVTAKGKLGADTAAFTSPPRSLLAQLQQAGTNADFAFLTRVFTGAPTDLDYSLDVRIDALVAGESSVLAGLVVGEGTPAEHAMAMVASDGDLFFEESYPTDAARVFNDTLILGAALPKGVWVRVRMHLSIATHMAEAFLDGKLAKTFALHPAWAPALPQIDLGYTYVAKQTSPWSVHFDNVVYDAK